MKITRILSVALLVLLAAAYTQALDMPNIRVSAEGKVQAMPDFIRLEINIEKNGEDKSGVKNQVDQITQNVLDAAGELGIDKKHIEASQFFIQPQYRWHEGKRSLTGTKVQRTVRIKLYDLAQYTAVAEAMAGMDITGMIQQGFGFDKPEIYRNAALVKALKNAEQKAKLIANTLGRKLDEVYQVSESVGFNRPVPAQRLEARAMAPGKAQGAPLEIKPQTVTATVDMIYLLD